MMTLVEIENRVASEFPMFREQGEMSEYLESYSFAKDGSFNEKGTAERWAWFEKQSDEMVKLMASILPRRAPDVHSAISHLFMGPIEQEVRGLENRDRCYCYIVDELHQVFATES